MKRAKALKSALLSPKYQLPPNLSFHGVVADLCACHRLQPDASALAEAIVVAVDHSKLIFGLTPVE